MESIYRNGETLEIAHNHFAEVTADPKKATVSRLRHLLGIIKKVEANASEMAEQAAKQRTDATHLGYKVEAMLITLEKQMGDE